MALSVMGVGLIGTVYTTAGGLKGVIWVDAIQMLIILGSMLAIIGKGTAEVGGFGEVWQRAADGGRLKFNEFDLNPTARHTYWTQSIGGAMVLIVIYTNQAITQKFLGLPTRKQMFITSYTSLLAISSYLVMFGFTGLVMYAYYYDCSPLLTGKVRRADQLLPVFVLEMFHGVYGFAGLFTAAVFSASLSTMAAGINALAAVTMLDVISPVYTRQTGREQLEPRRKILVFKGLVVIYGLTTIGFAFLAPYLGAGLLQLALNLLGVVGAPMLAVFIMGIFMPCVNSVGASVGLIVSLVFMFWLSLGGIYVTGKYSLHIRSMLPLNGTCSSSAVRQVADNVTALLYHVTTTSATNVVTRASNLHDACLECDVTEMTVSNWTGVGGVSTAGLQHPSSLEKFYMISYMWYSCIAIAVALIVAFLVSWCSGFRRNRPVDKTLSYMCCYKETQQDEPQITVNTLEYHGKVTTV
jgi:SSS family transporter